jgi:cytoskeleton protein RodZ
MVEIGQAGGDAAPEFGDELKRARELRGISLKEIADSTKISKRFLEALERNDLGALPAAVFTRGFVREYSRYLGLNTEEMVTRYEQTLRVHEEASIAKEAAQVDAWNAAAKRKTAPIKIRQREVIERRPFPMTAVVSGIVIVALVGIVAYLVRGRDRTAAVAQTSTVAAAATPVPVRSPASSTAPPAVEGLLLQLKLVEDSWLTLEIDGNVVVNDELKSGEEKTFEAKETINFKTVGNAAGIDVTLNGVKVPPFGESGDVVRNRKFDRDSVDALTQTRTE